MRIIFALLLMMSLGCQAFASPADVINNFAFGMAKNISEESYFFSPYSIISAFGMAYAGAEGLTAAEMNEALGFSREIHGELGAFVQDIEKTGDVSSANRVWLRSGLTLKDDYSNTLYLYYRSTAHELDIKNDTYNSRETINAWVSENTNGKINDLLRTLDPDTQMILTNAVYFNAEWLSPFEKEATKPEKFYDGDNVCEVPMMKQYDDFMYCESDGVKVVRLPYEGRRLSMIVVLPPKGENVSLDAGTLKKYTDAMTKYEVDLWLPKFKTERRYELKEIFGKMGVNTAFSNRANFSGITDDEKLKIDAVIHQTFIDVDEEKTEAAAATAVMMMRATALPMEEEKLQAEFHADHPFMYFIVDNYTGTILFMGRQTFR